MPLYDLALFLHILGSFGLIASLTIEAVGLQGLRSAQTAEQARPWLSSARILRIIAPGSIALILVMGLYLMASAWGWTGWIVSSLAALVLIGIIGGLVTGTRMARIGPVVGRAQGTLTDELRGRLRDPLLVLSSRVRIALVLGVLFLMSVKPSAPWSIAWLLLAAALGVASAPFTAGRITKEFHASNG